MPHIDNLNFTRTLCLGWLLAVLLSTGLPLHAQEDRKMVALVNGAVIFQSDLDNALRRYYHPVGGDTAGKEAAIADLAAAADADADTASLLDPRGVRQQLMENLIDRELLVQEAQRQGLTVSRTRVLRRIEGLPDEMRPKPVAANATDTADGGEDAFFRYVHTGMLIERLLDKQLPQVGAVSVRSARAYYEKNAALFIQPEEVHLRHILIKVSPEMTAEARQQAYLRIQAIEQQLAEGGNFTALAIDASQCPSSQRGGDLGLLTRDQLYPMLAEVAFDLMPGERSGIVESPAGYHLLLVTDRRPARQLSFLMVREGLQRRLRAEQQYKAARNFIRELRKDASVERLLE
jgi:parvulin-like peptidyl-prolyl isomerase